jgi:hypothetical protein
VSRASERCETARSRPRCIVCLLWYDSRTLDPGSPEVEIFHFHLHSKDGGSIYKRRSGLRMIYEIKNNGGKNNASFTLGLTSAMCSALVTFTGHVHWSRPLVTFTGHVHWSRPLVTFTGHVHWSRSLVTFTGHVHSGHVHWPGPLARSTGHVHWSRPLVTSTGHVHWSRSLVTGHVHSVVRSTGHVHWSRPLITFTGHVHWSRSLVTFTGHVHWSRSLVTFTGHVHSGHVVHWSRPLVTFTGHVHRHVQLRWSHVHWSCSLEKHTYSTLFSPCLAFCLYLFRSPLSLLCVVSLYLSFSPPLLSSPLLSPSLLLSSTLSKDDTPSL